MLELCEVGEERTSADRWNKWISGLETLIPCIVSDLSDYVNFRLYRGAQMGILHREDAVGQQIRVHLSLREADGANPQSGRLSLTKLPVRRHPPVTRLQSVAHAKGCRGNKDFPIHRCPAYREVPTSADSCQVDDRMNGIRVGPWSALRRAMPTSTVQLSRSLTFPPSGLRTPLCRWEVEIPRLT